MDKTVRETTVPIEKTDTDHWESRDGGDEAHNSTWSPWLHGEKHTLGDATTFTADESTDSDSGCPGVLSLFLGFSS